MAVLTFDEIKEISLSKVDEWIKIAREDAKLLTMHYYGVGTDEYLKQISGLENADQLALRKKHALSNQFITENLLRPLDNVWSAKGGSIKLDITDSQVKDLKEKYDDLEGGVSASEYMQHIYKDKLISDPNGLLFVEVSKEGDKAYPTQKSIFTIKNMNQKGAKPEYVCFEPDIVVAEDDKEKQLLWLIDDAFYYRIQILDDSIKIIDEIPNSFNEVPAIKNSLIEDTLREIKLSPIHKQVDLLNKYLINGSVKEIYQFLHGYPVFWMYANKCGKCNGSGYVEGNKCTECDGTGNSSKKDVSDVIALRPPKSTDQPVLAPNVAGYVQPDLETWREQRVEQDWTWDLLFYSQWGTTTERKDNETATGRFIDVQPVNNRLNQYADMIEKVHTELLRLLGKFYYESFKGVNVHYGRRYLIETPNKLWEKYLNAKEKKSPISSLDQLLEQYYESEYQTNELLRNYYLKLIKVEPFVHNTNEEVINMPISDIEKGMKVYYSDWIKTVMINEVVDKDIETLKKELQTYVELKYKENGRQEANGQTGEA
jgi:hypothetical protein